MIELNKRKYTYYLEIFNDKNFSKIGGWILEIYRIGTKGIQNSVGIITQTRHLIHLPFFLYHFLKLHKEYAIPSKVRDNFDPYNVVPQTRL